MLTKTISSGSATTIHSNPSDVNEAVVTPPSDVSWGMDTNDFGTLTVLGAGVGDPLQRNAVFQSTGALGTTVITMACAGKTAQVSVVVGAAVLPFDHFNPSFD